MDKAYHYILTELAKTAIITNAFLIVLFERSLQPVKVSAKLNNYLRVKSFNNG